MPDRPASELLRELEAMRLLVTLPGYMRPDARDRSLLGWHLREVDEFLNPIYGSAETAHEQVLAALADLRKELGGGPA